MALYQMAIPIQSGTLSTAYHSGSGYYTYIRLPNGRLWYIANAYLTATTSVAAGTTNVGIFTLSDASGNTIASFTSSTAITATGTTLASFSETYRIVDCEDADSYIKFGFTNSGSGVQPINLVLHLELEDRRPGGAPS